MFSLAVGITVFTNHFLALWKSGSVKSVIPKGMRASFHMVLKDQAAS